DDNYDITFEDAVYIVSKKVEDETGNGEIDLPTDIDVKFTVTQTPTNNSYELKGVKEGYWAQLWNRNPDDTLGDEYTTDQINCVITLRIPDEMVKQILDGAEINREKIAEGLSVYYVRDVYGVRELVSIENFKIILREDGSFVKFNYNGEFRAEMVLNAPNVKTPRSTIPWWIWLVVGVGAVTAIGIFTLIIVVIKKKNSKGSTVIMNNDDPATRRKLAEHDALINELLNRDDGGFGDHVEIDENGNIK
ncbi:MAG: hypothetical protein K2K04_07180, partial [Clostridia bacterium]|nr:hypothetical protein [Clostridia bacterium]